MKICPWANILVYACITGHHWAVTVLEDGYKTATKIETI